MADLAKKDGAIKTIKDLLDKSAGEFERALPRHLDIDRFMRIAFTTIRQNPKLLECSATSLLAAVMQAAQLGLEPDGILGHAYLVPYRNSKTGSTEAQFQVGYKGLISLARRSGEVRSICAHVVHENDFFDFAYGLHEKLEHKPARSERGKSVAAYAIAHFKDGGYAFEVMFSEDIEKIRAKSKAKDAGPWVDYTEEMWRKTAVRRLAKYLPLSVEFQRAAALDEYADLVGMEHISGGQNKKEIANAVMAKFDKSAKEPSIAEPDCGDPKTCGKAMGPDERGVYGCERTQQNCDKKEG